MGLSLKRFTKGVLDQVNPFDGGKTFANPIARPQPAQAPQQQAAKPTMGGGLPLYQDSQVRQRTAPAPVNDSQQTAATVMNMPIWDPKADPQPKPLGYSPMDETTRAAVDTAAKEYKWTPQFRDIVARAQPTITRELDSRGIKGATAAGTYSAGKVIPYNQYVNNQSIRVAPSLETSRVLTHEGLHAADLTDFKNRKDFAQAYDKYATPGVKKALAERTRMYAEAQNEAAFNRVRSLNPSMRTEVHSYLAEQMNIPEGLNNYYKRYYDVNAVPTRQMEKYRTYRSLSDALNGYQNRRARASLTEDY